MILRVGRERRGEHFTNNNIISHISQQVEELASLFIFEEPNVALQFVGSIEEPFGEKTRCGSTKHLHISFEEPLGDTLASIGETTTNDELPTN